MRSNVLFTWTWLVCVLFGLVACSKPTYRESQVSESVATIDGESITADAFKAKMARQPGRFATEEQKKSLLDEMIRSEILYAAARRAGYDRDPQVVARIRRLIADTFRQDNLEPRLTELAVSEAEIKKYYKKHQADFATPKKVRGAIIQITVPAGASEEKKRQLLQRAETARAEAVKHAQENPSFGAVAIKYSDDQATRYRGGDSGWLEAGKARSRWEKEVMDALFTLTEPGQISPIIKTASGYYLVKLMELKESAPHILEEVKDWIRHKIFNDKKNRVVNKFYAELEKKIPVMVNHKLVASIEPPAGKLSSKPMEPPTLGGSGR